MTHLEVVTKQETVPETKSKPRGLPTPHRSIPRLRLHFGRTNIEEVVEADEHTKILFSDEKTYRIPDIERKLKKSGWSDYTGKISRYEGGKTMRLIHTYSEKNNTKYTLIFPNVTEQ